MTGSRWPHSLAWQYVRGLYNPHNLLARAASHITRQYGHDVYNVLATGACLRQPELGHVRAARAEAFRATNPHGNPRRGEFDHHMQGLRGLQEDHPQRVPMRGKARCAL